MKKKVIISSLLSIVMCLSIAVGATFAWFTNTANTNVNKIQAGTLDVALEMYNPETNEWENAEGKTLQFLVEGRIPAEGTQIFWEPGCTYKLPAIRIINKGNLALKYKVIITGINGDAKLNEVIDWTISGTEDGTLAAEEYKEVVISGHMQETAGNEYQGLSIDGISITVLATQASVESDSTGSDYDEDAEFPESPVIVNQAVAKDEAGNVTDQKLTKIGDDDKLQAEAVIPAEAVADNAMQMALKVSESTIPANFEVAAGEVASTYEVKVSGLKEDNDVAVTVKLYVGAGLSGVGLTHRSGDSDIAFAAVASEDAVVENTFYYDGVNGYITFASATFSPFTVTYKYAANIDGVDYIYMDEALKAVKDGSTVTFMSNYEGNIEFSGKKDLTVDFNGNTVKGYILVGCRYDRGIWATTPSEITFKDTKGNGGVTSDDSYGTVIAMGNSKVTVESGVYTNVCKGSYSRVLRIENSTLVVNGGKFVCDTGNNYGRLVDMQYSASKVTVNGGEFIGSTKSYGVIFYSGSGSTAEVTVNNGTFTTRSSYGWLADVVGKVTINDCTFTAENHKQVFDANAGSVITVKGGVYTVADNENNLSGFVYCNKSLANAYGYVKGTIIFDPVTEIKINTTTHKTILTDSGVQQSAKGADGYYTITKAE